MHFISGSLSILLFQSCSHQPSKVLLTNGSTEILSITRIYGKEEIHKKNEGKEKKQNFVQNH